LPKNRIFAPLENNQTVMPELKYIVLVYLAVITVVTFLVYGIDKWKAQRKRWRIPESVLLGLAVIGGSVGAWLGMKIWRHKTQHKKFKYGVPAIFVAQVAVVVWLLSANWAN
jgi:uncharacterized membrane protein YsdA (DUF1294 family)